MKRITRQVRDQLKEPLGLEWFMNFCSRLPVCHAISTTVGANFLIMKARCCTNREKRTLACIVGLICPSVCLDVRPRKITVHYTSLAGHEYSQPVDSYCPARIRTREVFQEKILSVEQSISIDIIDVCSCAQGKNHANLISGEGGDHRSSEPLGRPSKG